MSSIFYFIERYVNNIKCTNDQCLVYFIERYIKQYEEENVCRILKETFTEVNDSSVSTDRVHICLEKNMELSLDFKMIRTCVLNCFTKARHLENDDR